MRRPLRAAAVMLMAATAFGVSFNCAAADEGERVLRVCADPNNLPYSNEALEGFENRLAQTVANDLHAKIEYTWWAQRRGFVRNTLQAGKCDVILGVPAGYELTRTTRPYYRSGYVFVTRADRGLDITSLDDALLRRLRIGVHVIGPDQTPPPAAALAARGIIENVAGYSVFGDYREPNPPLRLLDAVFRGDIDLAIAWGPFAGYSVRQHPGALRLVPVPGITGLPVDFSIAMGVRKDDSALQAELNRIIEQRAHEIHALLESYGVPLMPEQGIVR